MSYDMSLGPARQVFKYLVYIIFWKVLYTNLPQLEVWWSQRKDNNKSKKQKTKNLMFFKKFHFVMFFSSNETFFCCIFWNILLIWYTTKLRIANTVEGISQACDALSVCARYQSKDFWSFTWTILSSVVSTLTVFLLFFCFPVLKIWARNWIWLGFSCFGWDTRTAYYQLR